MIIHNIEGVLVVLLVETISKSGRILFRKKTIQTTT